MEILDIVDVIERINKSILNCTVEIDLSENLSNHDVCFYHEKTISDLFKIKELLEKKQITVGGSNTKGKLYGKETAFIIARTPNRV